MSDPATNENLREGRGVRGDFGKDQGVGMKKGWNERQICDVCLVTDYVANGSFAALRENVQYLDEDGYAVLVRLADSTRGWNGNYKFVSEAAYRFLKKSSLIPGDLVMSNVGEPGKVFVVPDLGKPMTLGPNSVLIRCNAQDCESQFLFYYFSSNAGRSQIDEISEGVAQKKFNKTAFRALKLPVPPLAEQQRIVGLLDEAFEGLATAKSNAEKNLQNARALFESHLQSVFTQRGSGWVEKKVCELLEKYGGEIKTGPFGTKLKASEYTETGVPVISVGEVRLGKIVLHDRTPRVDRGVTDRMPEYVLEEGDIVFGRKGGVERSACVRKDQAGWFLGSDGIRLRLPTNCNRRFLAYQFLSPTHKNWMLNQAVGTTMPSLNQKIIERIPIAICSLPQQQSIVEQLDALSEQTQHLARLYEQKLAALEALKKSLLHQAFTGEL